jgi:glucose/arabinose dehydrogenase
MMIMKHRLAAPARELALLLLLAPAGASAQAVLLPERDQPLLLEAAGQQIRVVLVADGLVGPWDIEFVPGGESMLVTESAGRLRIIRDGALDPATLWEVPEPRGRDVLHGVVVHPDFEQNGFVYVSYTKADGEKLTLAVSRGRLEGSELNDVREIFVADAWETASNATAGRMIYGPDGMLYVTVGDRDRLCCGPKDDNSIRILSQDLSNHVGKTLRLTDGGSVPDDNPFVGQAGAKPEIFTYGNRNTYGLAFHPETGELWTVDIGPLGGDEINILRPGRNYGWPLVSMGHNYSGTLVSDQPWYRPGMEMPRMFWVPVISPSSITFYTGDAFPEWKNNAFVTALSGQQVQRIAFDQPGQAERRDPMLTELGLRFRDVQQGPDGYLYVATEVRYASGNPDGTILRIEPAE